MVHATKIFSYSVTRYKQYLIPVLNYRFIAPCVSHLITIGDTGVKLVLPLKDDTIPGQDDDHIFTSENNFFDFSTVDILPLEEFRNISDRADVCPKLIKLRGSSSFRLQGKSERKISLWGKEHERVIPVECIEYV